MNLDLGIQLIAMVWRPAGACRGLKSSTRAHHLNLTSMRLLANACLLGSAAALLPSLSPASALRVTPLGRVQRARRLVAQSLPAGWTTAIDQASGTTYFCFAETGECQWEPPIDTQQGGYAQQAQVQQAQTQTQTQDLPAGWTSAIDQSSGTTYYCNTQTGECQWDTPAQHAQQDQAPAQQDHAQQVQAQEPWEMPAGWTSAVDQASGTTYYCEVETGQCQWEQPTADQAVKKAPKRRSPAPQTSWRLAANEWSPRFGGVYKMKVGDAEVLGRYDLGEWKHTRPFVSRDQCLVHVGDDGTATLQSRSGHTPTLYRAPNGPWFALMQGEKTLLAHGDQVSLDYNDPEGTVFTCHDERHALVAA